MTEGIKFSGFLCVCACTDVHPSVHTCMLEQRHSPAGLLSTSRSSYWNLPYRTDCVFGAVFVQKVSSKLFGTANFHSGRRKTAAATVEGLLSELRLTSH